MKIQRAQRAARGGGSEHGWRANSQLAGAAEPTKQHDLPLSDAMAEWLIRNGLGSTLLAPSMKKDDAVPYSINYRRDKKKAE